MYVFFGLSSALFRWLLSGLLNNDNIANLNCSSESLKISSSLNLALNVLWNRVKLLRFLYKTKKERKKLNEKIYFKSTYIIEPKTNQFKIKKNLTEGTKRSIPGCRRPRKCDQNINCCQNVFSIFKSRQHIFDTEKSTISHKIYLVRCGCCGGMMYEIQFNFANKVL